MNVTFELVGISTLSDENYGQTDVRVLFDLSIKIIGLPTELGHPLVQYQLEVIHSNLILGTEMDKIRQLEIENYMNGLNS
jgi:hypothetical protein